MRLRTWIVAAGVFLSVLAAARCSRTAGQGQTISGADIGFQITAPPDARGRIVGRIVVRIDGQWRETTGMVGAMPAVDR